jgi:hypothetical protein
VRQLPQGVYNKTPDFIVFSGSKEYRYGLIIDKCQSQNTLSLIYKISTLIREHRWHTPTVAREVA